MEYSTNLSSGMTTQLEPYSLINSTLNSINTWHDNRAIAHSGGTSPSIAPSIAQSITDQGIASAPELSLMPAVKLEIDAIRVVEPMRSSSVTVDQNDNRVMQPDRFQSLPIASATNAASVNETCNLETRDALTGIHTNAAIVSPAIAETQAKRTKVGGSTALAYPGYLLKYEPGKPLKFDIYVKQWQQRMNDRGWKLSVDGFYGLQSRQVTRQFQKEKGLTVDGIVGLKTWTETFRTDNVTGGAISDPPTPIPPSGAGGSTGATSAINQAGLTLVKNSEGFRSQAYRDPVGIWTIGYGHTGVDVQPGDVISRAEADDLLKKDLRKFETQVRRLVKVPLTSNQFSALVSFTYNVGAGNLATSTLLRLLNQRNYQGAANQFSRWNQAGGQVLSGLVRRRNAERALFLKPASRY